MKLVLNPESEYFLDLIDNSKTKLKEVWQVTNDQIVELPLLIRVKILLRFNFLSKRNKKRFFIACAEMLLPLFQKYFPAYDKHSKLIEAVKTSADKTEIKNAAILAKTVQGLAREKEAVNSGTLIIELCTSKELAWKEILPVFSLLPSDQMFLKLKEICNEK